MPFQQLAYISILSSFTEKMRRKTPPPEIDPAKQPVKLERFVKAQKGLGNCTKYDTAAAELRLGRKQSCWIWYVMPQVKDPARLSMRNEEFQVFNRSEAVAYLKHESLRQNYLEVIDIVTRQLKAAHPDAAAGEVPQVKKKAGHAAPEHIGRLFSTMVDAKKCYHSVTTFALAAVETMDTDLLKVFYTALSLITVSLKVADDVLTQRKEASIMQWPTKGQRVVVGEGHPLSKSSGDDGGESENADVAMARAIVAMCDPIILERWNSFPASVEQCTRALLKTAPQKPVEVSSEENRNSSAQ